MSQREIAVQLILDEVGKGHTIDEAVQRIINRPQGATNERHVTGAR